MKVSSFIVQLRPGFFRLMIHAKPGARSTALAAQPQALDEALEVRLAAPPVDGKANTELVEFMQTLLEQQLATLRITQKQHLRKSGCEDGEDEVYTYEHYAKKKKSKNNKRMNEDSKSGEAKVEYPDDKVRVSLVSGLTSRNKVLEVTFPGTEEDLLAVLKSADFS
ncbi:Uncharacterized ACR, YggU family COG1872, putative [Trypanosoma equiperdum]|uniref:Uncharacterized protein n=3 Tax=Trypanozoon TaxID=39700 RepID=Q583Y5_TRYB2|nr:hypothetical protein, conserved [Trypanosoma brucei brucei TREU927]AAX79847.1 hypothetical protein, conserved [Trypanosoma brucei]AAZ10899.1 hypothetical protein, conserved [Trypanosoma brucei brucei TREU927]RHW72672.1 putative ACR [Trypanosoma brucei equiperdum]SCU67088.1 Uncharacterised ACR, YggU family COG1872, putative [Trypanosoma equiperdum]